MQELIIKKAEGLEKSNGTPAATAFRQGLQGIDKVGVSLKPLEAQRTSLAQKLWDGRIQLSSSVVVPVVAFFKSGEKMPDAKWSELVEVKGKVKLEGFEKYIQELSRSRNRGLMVTLLCWKEEASKSGLVGMKKVVDSYKADGRVGLAQISEGIGLYLCPRSDAIITILAKHGFFKGKSAVIENQDSLIGCVVWRRAVRAVTKSEKKNPSFKEQSLNCISDNAPKEELAQTELACEKTLVDGLVQGTATEDCSTPESACSGGSEYKNVERSIDWLKLLNSYASSSSFFQTILGPEKCKPALPLPPVDTKDHVLTQDDDELPEFDFGPVRRKSQAPTSKPLKADTEYKIFLIENYGKINQHVDYMPALNKRKMENVNPRSDVIVKLPRLMEHNPTAALPSFTERNRALIRQYGNGAPSEPAWRPPETARHRISQSTPATLAHSQLLISDLGSLHPCHPYLPQHSFSPALSTRALPYTDINFGVIPAQTELSSSMSFNANSLVRPPTQRFNYRSPRNPHGSRVLQL